MILKNNNIDRKMIILDIITSIFCLIPILAGVILYSKLPSKIAVHFDVNDKPNIYAGKIFVVFGFPLLMLLVHAILCIVLETDNKKSNVNHKIAYILRFVVPFVTVAVEGFIFIYALSYNITAYTFSFILCGTVIFILGNYLPKCKQNRHIAFRLPWTIKDEINWNKTHHLAGWLWIASGIFLIILGALNLPEALCTVPFIMIFVVPCIYSFLISLKGENRGDKVDE